MAKFNICYTGPINPPIIGKWLKCAIYFKNFLKVVKTAVCAACINVKQCSALPLSKGVNIFHIN
jgi:hypothetical protein